MILPHSKHNQSGQALLLVFLVMAVMLTLVLSVASRSVTEVLITTSEEDSLRAFSAAEAGIEEALLNPVVGTTLTGNTDSHSSYTTKIIDPYVNSGITKHPNNLLSGEVDTFWLYSHDGSFQLTCNGKDCFSGNRIRVCYGYGLQGDSLPTEEVPAM